MKPGLTNCYKIITKLIIFKQNYKNHNFKITLKKKRKGSNEKRSRSHPYQHHILHYVK